MKHYNANDFANRTFRYKKYLLPAASLMPWLPRQAAPKSFCELPKPGNEKSDSASACGLFHYERIFTAESSESPATFVSAYVDGEVRELTVDRSEEHAQMVYCFEHGGCVGRNGCLVTSHNQAVRETAFLGKYGVQGVKRFSKLDPRYWIHRQRGNLTARRTIPAPQRVSGAAISMNNCSSHNFFHWLTEVAPRAIAAAQMVPLSTTKLIVDHQFAYQREILQLMGRPLPNGFSLTAICIYNHFCCSGATSRPRLSFAHSLPKFATRFPVDRICRRRFTSAARKHPTAS